jgi:hemoglobin
MAETMFERMGGEPVLRAVIDEFVDRVFEDVMIGFLFRRANRARIKRFEYEQAAAFLGAALEYGGRDLREAHRPHRIMGGQFARRKEILRQVLVKHGVPAEIAHAWLAHVESLRSLITHDGGSECTSVE